jgi:hypothetical protein
MIRTKLLPSIAGIASAIIVMILFEFTNSFFFPFPEGVDMNNLDVLRQFTAAQSPHIFILVWCGWAIGSLIAGYVTTHLSREQYYQQSAVVGLLLTLLGIANHFMLHQPLWFNILSFPVFILCTYVGHKYYLMTGAAPARK